MYLLSMHAPYVEKPVWPVWACHKEVSSCRYSQQYKAKMKYFSVVQVSVDGTGLIISFLPLICIIYFLQYIDKTAISYASVTGLRESANLHGNQFVSYR